MTEQSNLINKILNYALMNQSSGDLFDFFKKTLPLQLICIS